MNNLTSFFTKYKTALQIAATAYVVLLLLSHWQFPAMYVWVIAAFFSIAMNFTYLIEAMSVKRNVKAEAIVTMLLIATSLLGLMISPLLLIGAIFGHGCWDLAKHFGRGVPFFAWYTWSCFIVDSLYSASLLLFWLKLS